MAINLSWIHELLPKLSKLASVVIQTPARADYPKVLTLLEFIRKAIRFKTCSTIKVIMTKTVSKDPLKKTIAVKINSHQ